MLEIDGLYYPQAVFDSLLNQVMGEVLQGIIDKSSGPRNAAARIARLKSPAVRDRVYREAMRRTKASVPGIKAEEIADGYTLLPQKRPKKTA